MASTGTLPSVICLEQAQSGVITNVTYRLPSTDVNGIGVIVAFLLPAYISWCLVILLYIGGLTPPDLLNQFDILFLRVRSKKGSDWASRVHKATFILSAQQIVTGIGILAAGLATMSSMLVADFHSVIYLAWMSSNGFLATLTLLRDYLQDHASLRTFKLVAMVALFSMLCVAIFPTTNFAWADHILVASSCLPASPASSCLALNTYVSPLWHEASITNTHNKMSPQGGLSYAIILITYSWQATMLFRKAHLRIHQFIRTPLLWIERKLHTAALQRTEDHDHRFNKNVHYRLWLGLYLFCLAIWDIFSSFAAFLGMVTISSAWATYELLMPRLHVFPPCVQHALNVWDFGQILPLLLLFAPLYNIVEHCLQDRTPLRTMFNRNSQSSDIESTTPTHSQLEMNLSAIFTRLELSRHPVETDPTVTTTDSSIECSGLIALHEKIYSTAYFKILLTLLCILALGATIGYFVETTIALIGPYQPLSWHTQDWDLLPDMVAVFSAFGVLFLVTLLMPFCSQPLST